MYRDDAEALRARVETLQTELDAARKQRDAARAEARVAAARTAELEIRQRRLEPERTEPVLAPRYQPQATLLVMGVLAALMLVTGAATWPIMLRSRAPARLPPVRAAADPEPATMTVSGAANEHVASFDSTRTSEPRESGEPARSPEQVPPALSELIPAEVLEMHRRSFHELKDCDARVFPNGRPSTVMVKMSLEIGADGRVVGTSFTPEQPAALVDCIEEAARAWKFSSASGGEVVVPILFRAP